MMRLALRLLVAALFAVAGLASPVVALGSLQAVNAGYHVAAVTPPSLSFNTSAHLVSTTTSHSFAAVNIGATTAGRTVIVTASCAGAGGNASITGISVGGSAMTQIAATSPALQLPEAIFALAFTTGTTATIVVTSSANTNECYIGSYAAYNLASLTPDNTQVTTTNTTSALSQSVTTVNNGIALGIAGNVCADITPGGTLTSDFSLTGTNMNAAGQSGLTTGASSTLTVSSCSFDIAGALASMH